MSFSDVLENSVLDAIFGNTPISPPATWYVGVSTSTPNDDGTNFTEHSGDAYARVAVTNNATEWPAASGGAKSNANEVAFPVATGPWGTQTHFGLFSASTGGTPQATGALTTPKTPVAGDQLKFAAGDLTITLD